MDSPLTPGGPGGGGSPSPAAIDFGSRERTISMSPPKMINTAGAVGLRSLSPDRSSPRSFTGKVLEERAEDTAEALRDVVSSRGWGSPSRLRELEAGDEEADNKVRKSIETANERLTENAETLCKDNLHTHFRMLGLRNAVNLVPKLLTENKHLKREIVRARSTQPEDVQKDLVKIDEAKREFLNDQAAREAEENAAKQRLKEALESLRNGGFPDDDLVSFVSAALDSAIGVVFRTEDQRSQLQTELSRERSEAENLREKLASLREELQLQQCRNENLFTVNGDLEAQRKEDVAKIEDQRDLIKEQGAAIERLTKELNDVRKELGNTVKEKEAVETALETAKHGLQNSRQAEEDEINRLRNRYKEQLDEVEADRKKTAQLMTERLDEERAHSKDLERKWRDAETRALQAESNAQRESMANAQTAKEVTRLEAARDLKEAQSEDLSKKLAAAKDENTELKDEIRELKQLLNASVETAEGDRQIANQLRETNGRLAEQLKKAEVGAEEASRKLVEAELEATKQEAARRELEQQVREAEEARHSAATSLDEMGRKAMEMEEAYQDAIEAAKREREELENEKDRCLQEAMERLEMVDQLQREKEKVEGELKERNAALEKLSGAEEKLSEACEMREEVEGMRERAEKKMKMNEQAAAAMEAACKEFEKRVLEDSEGRMKAKDEQISRLLEGLKEEQGRNERTEARIAQCLEQLKTVEAQRVEAETDHKRQESTYKRSLEDADHRIRELQSRLHDLRGDDRYAKKNAKSVGWILAGRGALLRDLYKLHSMIQDPSATPQQTASARDLSNHIMATHLFECERRHLGMAPSENPEREGSPRAPSPRQSWRLFNHSPAARPQDPPVPMELSHPTSAGEVKRPRPVPANPKSVASPPSLTKSLDYW